jgi:hypothetical protein
MSNQLKTRAIDYSINDKKGRLHAVVVAPLFYGHINPYGLFYLDFEQPSVLDVA